MDLNYYPNKVKITTGVLTNYSTPLINDCHKHDYLIISYKYTTIVNGFIEIDPETGIITFGGFICGEIILVEITYKYNKCNEYKKCYYTIEVDLNYNLYNIHYAPNYVYINDDNYYCKKVNIIPQDLTPIEYDVIIVRYVPESLFIDGELITVFKKVEETQKRTKYINSYIITGQKDGIIEIDNNTGIITYGKFKKNQFITISLNCANDTILNYFISV